MTSSFTLGELHGVAAGDALGLLAPPTAAAVVALGWEDRLGVVAIDPGLADTAALTEASGLPDAVMANCVIVAGARNGVEKVAACVVLADSRADINTTVRKRLDVRKASFLAMDEAVSRTGMEYGGITPVGLPAEWALYVDARVLEQALVVMGSGVRASKIIAPGSLLAELPGAEVVEGLGRLIAAEPA